MKSKPRVSIVGAGPGDPDLITVKGQKALMQADVVLYDALSNDELLSLAPKSALKVYVGKRKNKHSYPQEEINRMIVSLAYEYGHVVRLKGGDPFVFGRGHEELSYVENFGIPVSIVPGISSCISVPELQKVPITRRGVSQSFWVVTATGKEGKLVNDIRLAARSSATVVILMGLRKLGKIAEIYKALGKEDAPVMVVQNGSLPKEKSVVGTFKNIEKLVAENKISTPAIITTGAVVSLHPDHMVELLDCVKL